ncbi:metallophosphoesterase [Niveispirillum sp. KHB5.9]|uniref:metallophosphoesterase n=1 Tax=Niveispirillum sp. KHB5.9 TaxID=3400269 RepID=UPI003A8758D2
MISTLRLFVCGLALMAPSLPALADDLPPIEIPRTPGLPYTVRNIPDRVVLTPGADPATEMAVSFRTDSMQRTAEAQLAIAVDGPTLEKHASTVTGTSTVLPSSNGLAHYHHVRFTGLKPDTVYAYRVKGQAGFTEWHQFKTAATEARPFRFMYLGDTQNGILDFASRVIRRGFHEGKVELVVHAGDLIAQRDDLDHDDEWGEWTQAGGYSYAMVPQLPATGNHEYADRILPDGSESRKLGQHWQAQFALPANGAAGLTATTYYVDYQGVRFIVLDGTAALDLGQLDVQTKWLDDTLAASKATWNFVLFHQPIFTCARPNDTEALKAAWKPIFDKRKVDLVLQGHDHCYSRLSSEAGRAAGITARKSGKTQGPVYLVSVAGSKMYGLNDRAGTQPDKVAEATELYQIVDVETGRLKFRTYTASGKLYDGFDLQRQKNGSNRMVELTEPMLATRTCKDGKGPDGDKCVAKAKD